MADKSDAKSVNSKSGNGCSKANMSGNGGSKVNKSGNNGSKATKNGDKVKKGGKSVTSGGGTSSANVLLHRNIPI